MEKTKIIFFDIKDYDKEFFKKYEKDLFKSQIDRRNC